METHQPTAQNATPNASAHAAMYAVHAAMILTGVMTALLGPMLPLLSARWTLTDARAGNLFTAQFAASIVGVGLSSVIARRWGYRACLALGVVLEAAGAGLLARASWSLGLTAVCLYGTGLGLAIPIGNLWTAELNPERRAAALNLLNFSWGVGAVGCPFAIAAFQFSHRIPLFLYGMTGALVLMAVLLSRISVDRTGVAQQNQGPSTGSKSVRAWSNPLVPILGALFFIYVGTEASLSGWVASYARRIDPSSQTLWALSPSFFWGMLLLGRALAPGMLRFMRETNLATAGLALASAATLLLISAHSLPAILVAASLAGFGLASVFPTNVALLSRWFGTTASPIASTMFALAGLGGAVLPWLVGIISTRFASLKLGLLVPLVGTLVCLILYFANRTTDALGRA